MVSPLLAVDRLTKSYGRTTALSAVSLTVRRGEVLGLIGPNGAGKTTLFECIAGVLPFEAGQVRFDGQAIVPPDRGGRIFYLPDGIAPWPAQPVRWALEFAVGFFGGDAAALPRVIERLELQPLLGSPIGTLSKGQRKRALLAVGMLTPHPLLLCDEPFDGLDLRQTREVGAALREHAAAGRTLFLSIHQIPDAARMCDRFVLLSGGRVCGEGTAEELAGHAASSPSSARPSSLEDTFLALT
jgi:ABC-2 type transport system ATP-binding protein